MKFAVVGCVHGELSKIYDTIEYIQEKEKITVDLLICCGDFQAFRNISDMKTMAAPEKYQEMKDFHEYYTGKKKAPMLTVFIGGNHESANYLWELPYGGWVTENIYFMGFAGVLNFRGLRIGGISGIYKNHDYHKGHFEKPPFNDQTKRSFYHVRSCDVAKLKLLREKEIDIFLSHDWPQGIYNHGNWKQLIKFKPYFREEIEKNTLGNPAAEELLDVVKPKYWFAGHMHAKFVAIVDHGDDYETKFLALGKCVPQKDFLQIVDIDTSSDEKHLKFDPEWITILQKNNGVYSLSSKKTFLTELDESCKPSQSDIENFISSHDDLTVFPFSRSINGLNEQTQLFADKFNLLNPCVQTDDCVISNNSFGSSQKRFHPKMSIPRPKLNLPDKNEIHIPSPTHVNTSVQSSDFDELVNPNHNPDEIEISESESSNSESGSDSDEEHSGRLPIKMKNFQYHSNMSTVESPSCRIYESTPNKIIGENSAESAGNESFNDVTSSGIGSDSDLANNTPQPKKFKLVRRNQEIYTAPHNDESE